MPPPRDGPALRSGAVVAEAELAALAAEAVRRSGLTLTAVAERLGKALPSVSDAVNRPDKSLTALRISILQALAGYTAVGPLYRLQRTEAGE
jgi:hypothetical protein